jgi:uncharacterized phiE125 gp8 family phage protein
MNQTNYVELTSATGAITLDEAKLAANIPLSETVDDAYLSMLILAATQLVEAKTGRALIQRSFVQYLDGWPDVIEIPVSPLVSITKIEYYDGDNVKQTLATDQYDVAAHATPGYVSLAWGMVWPVLYNKPEAVQVTFLAGFAASVAALDAKAKQLVSFLANHWYMHREPVVTGTAILSQKVPKTFDYTLNSLRVMRL